MVLNLFTKRDTVSARFMNKDSYRNSEQICFHDLQTKEKDNLVSSNESINGYISLGWVCGMEDPLGLMGSYNVPSNTREGNLVASRKIWDQISTGVRSTAIILLRKGITVTISYCSQKQETNLLN